MADGGGGGGGGVCEPGEHILRAEGSNIVMSAAKYNEFIFRAAYSYAPCGETTASGDVSQPFRWSSEFDDEELGLVYYNYPTVRDKARR